MVIAAGTLYSTGVVDLAVDGDTYREVDNPRGRRPGDPIVVTEFFSYGCIHCRNFDPLIENWRDDLPDGVTFQRAPVSYSPMWRLLAQAYLVLEREGGLEQNHDRLFAAVHDAGRQFLSADMLADFVAGNGIERDRFLTAFESRRTARQIDRIQADAQLFGVASVPTLVVGDRYVINMDIGRKQALAVADQLVEKIRQQESGGG